MTREQEETQGGPGGLGGPQGARQPKPRGKGGNLGELRQQQRRVGEGKERRRSRGRAVRGPPCLSGAGQSLGEAWRRRFLLAPAVRRLSQGSVWAPHGSAHCSVRPALRRARVLAPEDG